MLFTSVSQVIKTYNGNGERNKDLQQFPATQKYLDEFCEKIFSSADGGVPWL